MKTNRDVATRALSEKPERVWRVERLSRSQALSAVHVFRGIPSTWTVAYGRRMRSLAVTASLLVATLALAADPPKPAAAPAPAPAPAPAAGAAAPEPVVRADEKHFKNVKQLTSAARTPRRTSIDGQGAVFQRKRRRRAVRRDLSHGCRRQERRGRCAPRGRRRPHDVQLHPARRQDDLRVDARTRPRLLARRRMRRATCGRSIPRWTSTSPTPTARTRRSSFSREGYDAEATVCHKDGAWCSRRRRTATSISTR